MTAELDGPTTEMLNELRERHFPPNRNQLPAHLTLFHHLRGNERTEVENILAQAATDRLPLAARLGPPRSLGHGVAFGIESPDLIDLRAAIAARLPSPLGSQDRGWHWPHVTVQNKVTSEIAQDLQAKLTVTYAPRPAEVIGLILWRYLGGPWERLAHFS